jgi:uracil phosphoribosyltransferase
MRPAIELEDPHHLYDLVRDASGPSGPVRRRTAELGGLLARGVRGYLYDRLGGVERILAVVILRGGILLYPGFAVEFAGADFCLAGMRRADSRASVRCDYLTVIPRGDYDAVLYLDCVCATGATLLETRRVVSKECVGRHEIAAVISGSEQATRTLCEADITVLGLSLYESLQDGLVLPDLGELDAGDLFSGAVR